MIETEKLVRQASLWLASIKRELGSQIEALTNDINDIKAEWEDRVRVMREWNDENVTLPHNYEIDRLQSEIFCLRTLYHDSQIK